VQAAGGFSNKKSFNRPLAQVLEIFYDLCMRPIMFLLLIFSERFCLVLDDPFFSLLKCQYNVRSHVRSFGNFRANTSKIVF
jgi:hypothetical protein